MNTLLYTQLAVKCSVGFRFSWNFWGVNQGYNLEGGRHLVSQYLRPISCSRPLNIIMKNEWWEINDRNHSTASSDRLELSSTNGSARPGPYTTLSRMNNRKWHHTCCRVTLVSVRLEAKWYTNILIDRHIVGHHASLLYYLYSQ